MPALLANIRIDTGEKLELFKATLADLAGLFKECHLKFRGAHAEECVQFAREQLGLSTHFYQDLQEGDWVGATLKMLGKVESRSVFLYFEDHKLVTSRERLEQTLAGFDQSNLDYLCYSFFKGSKLDASNVLPLGAVQHELFTVLKVSRSRLELLGRISPRYYIFSLISVASVAYFTRILTEGNKRTKVSSRILVSILKRLYPYPRHRRVIHKLNATLSAFDATVCLYDPSSPFNLEKMWFEAVIGDEGWNIGIPTQELFANFDDDNGAYGDSLIKMGLYPFDAHRFDSDALSGLKSISNQVALSAGQMLDCTYYSHNDRLRSAPIVRITVVRGSVSVDYRRDSFPLSANETRMFYSNLRPVVHCVDKADLEISVFDEVLG